MRLFVVVEDGEIGAGKDDETAGLGRLGGNLHGRNGDKEPPSAGPTLTLPPLLRLCVNSSVGASGGKTVRSPLEHQCVRRLPRPTGLPARTFGQSEVVADATTSASPKAPSLT